MANLTLNLIFASIFAGFAWNSLPRGWRFFRLGWQANQTKPDKSGDKTQHNRQVSSSFLLAGTAWLIGGIASALLTIMFVGFAIFNVGIFDFVP